MAVLFFQLGDDFMVSRKVVVENTPGLYLRHACALAKESEKCSSKTEILFKHSVINTKSLLNIVSMAITKGDELELRCTGPDEQKDLNMIMDVLVNLQ
jgi:phosphocarrier protein